MPHELIFFALKRYGIHPEWIQIIKSYYSDLWSRSFSFDAPSGWHQHFRGIFQGCTASIILFLVAMNIVIKFVCAEINLTITPSPPVKAFMDDLYLQANSVEKTQSLLDRANTALTWARMKLKPCKSKCLIISAGQVKQDQVLSIQCDEGIQTIPSIKNNPVNFLGRKISFTLKEKDQVEAFSSAVSQRLLLIDKSFHRGIQKFGFYSTC